MNLSDGEKSFGKSPFYLLHKILGFGQFWGGGSNFEKLSLALISSGETLPRLFYAKSLSYAPFGHITAYKNDVTTFNIIGVADYY